LHRSFRVKYREVTKLKEINSEVPQDSVLRLVLYLLHTADFPALDCTIAIYVNDIAILIADNNHIEASLRLQESLSYIQKWLKKWRIKASGTKSVDVTFTIRKETCPSVTVNSLRIPQAEDVKYLGLHLDHSVNWKKACTYQTLENNLNFNWKKCTVYWTITYVD